MIANIRSYINKSVKSIDSDLKPAKFALVGEIADTKLEDTFEVIFGSMSSQRNDTDITSTIPVTVNIYKNGYNDEIALFDKYYCKAIDIQARAMNQKLFHVYEIEDVISSGIEVETVLTNDNLYKFSIQFTIRTSYIDN